ncbi:proline-rich receptor-like protein kinase PERK9 [Marmota marmota marmota]|uniref:proline-rich receptor-like protein kinase PERK9 n=1 Tax=Marmota marmota marmota TaxID=9994 RepID=UPI0007622638|nr:proline-rich receptor-like protein kinase PERK9 [Marmota marmota marmota]
MEADLEPKLGMHKAVPAPPRPRAPPPSLFPVRYLPPTLCSRTHSWNSLSLHPALFPELPQLPHPPRPSPTALESRSPTPPLLRTVTSAPALLLPPAGVAPPLSYPGPPHRRIPDPRGGSPALLLLCPPPQVARRTVAPSLQGLRKELEEYSPATGPRSISPWFAGS